MLYLLGIFIIILALILIKENGRKSESLSNINRRLRIHYDILQEKGYEVVCLCLQGSQNYGLDEYSNNYQSDVDTKAIVLPHFRDFVMDKEPESTTIILDNNEHIDVKDIRVMFEMFKKQNISYLELLFTKYKIINPKYKKLIKPLFEANEQIAAANKVAFVKCIAGMAMEKKKALCHPYPTLIEKIEKYGFDGKQLSHCARLTELLDKWMMNLPMDTCFMSDDRRTLMNYKKQLVADGSRVMMQEEAIKLCDMYCRIIQDMKEQVIEVYGTEGIDEGAFELLNKIKYDILKKKFKEEI